jgi:hypothetical protein
MPLYEAETLSLDCFGSNPRDQTMAIMHGQFHSSYQSKLPRLQLGILDLSRTLPDLASHLKNGEKNYASRCLNTAGFFQCLQVGKTSLCFTHASHMNCDVRFYFGRIQMWASMLCYTIRVCHMSENSHSVSSECCCNLSNKLQSL